ncbi:MAG: hypothetical protein HYX62_01365 [Gammaproteobacteria bacterium]|nr:hypothetical protein [Gammaproteobacteria bacterium]
MPRPKAVFGVGIGRDRLYAAHTIARKEGWYIQQIKQVSLPFNMFSGIPTPEVCQALASSLSELCSEVKFSYVPIQIALPDPVVSLRVFELDALPKTGKEQLALARWRFNNEMHFAERPIACSCQYLGAEKGKHLLLALAIDQAWLDCLKEACRAASVTSTVIDMAACYGFNRFCRRLVADGSDAVLIYLDQAAWTLSITDAQGRLRFVHARWRDSVAPDKSESDGGYQGIATEAERCIRIYAHAAAGRVIKHIYVTGNSRGIAGVADALEQRMEGQCIKLPGETGFTCGPGVTPNDLDTLGSTLAAAMLR